MRVLSYNILDGGEDWGSKISQIIASNRPDIAVMVEADDEHLVSSLAQRLKMEYVFAEGKLHSAAILSRFPILKSVNHAQLLEDVTNSFLMATLATPEVGELTVAAVHLHAHGTFADEDVRLREIRAILEVLSSLRREKRPHLLAGDFNANSPIQHILKKKCKTRTQKEMDENGGELPREVIRQVLAAGYQDTFQVAAGERATEIGTFNTKHPGQRVDYIFSFGLPDRRVADAWVDQSRVAASASDHFPIGIELA